MVDVESLVDHTCSSLGIKEDAYGNVLIAVTEAVNNAIEHGNSFNSDLSVGVTVLIDQRFCLAFQMKEVVLITTTCPTQQHQKTY